MDTFEPIKFKKRKIGIMGGSFNPPTLDHLRMASEALNLGGLDEVWMVPCGSRPDKPSLRPAKERLKMVQLAIEDSFPKDFPIKTNDIEVKHG